MEATGKRRGDSDFLKMSSKQHKARTGATGRPNGRAGRQDEEMILPKQSRGLTVCLVCLLGAVACLSPYLSLHLSQRVGLLLFESDLIQLRASSLSVIISTVVLVVLFSICEVTFKLAAIQSKRNWLFQRLLKLFLSLLAVLSAISYLALVLVVPQVKQTQRMPMATFDCNANLITIENCQQQFMSHGPEQSFGEALEVLFQDQQQQQQQDNQNRLIKKLNCLKYNDKELDKVPTRFLLHHCALVCKTQRQQLHQFGDDLNQDQTYASDQPLYKRQQAPYDHNYSSPTMRSNSNGRQVSLKVCFSSGEFSSTSNNYKQFCITNLAAADNQHIQGQTMTVGQLNAMLRGLVPAELDTRQTVDYASATFNRPGFQEEPFEEMAGSEAVATSAAQVVAEQATHYVNPVVQFESHFKNWPHLHRTTLLNRDGETIAIDGANVADNHQLNNVDSDTDPAWCKFRPIPPFIVNNKPFSDIQCSLEHEYTMSSASPLAEADNSKIYLRKLANHQANDRQISSGAERCNIQCKVNILYQVQVLSGSSSSTTEDSRNNQHQFYLPLRPCLMVSPESDKTSTTNHYLLFRSLGDSSLALAFILLDLLLLFESHHLKQSHLESKKFRLVGLLLILTLLPLVVAIIFDLIAARKPSAFGAQGNSVIYFQELVVDLIQSLSTKPRSGTSKSQTNGSLSDVQPTTALPLHRVLDSYILPSFAYAILMFILAINSLKLPLVPFESPLVRVSSVEELGIAPKSISSNGNGCSIKIKETGVKAFQKEDTSSKRKTMMKLISFMLLALFMGTQFHLSQISQTQILIETFGNPSLERTSSNNEATWFTIATTSTSFAFLLLLVLVFHRETSNFFSQFQMFKNSTHMIANKVEFMRKRAKLIQYLALASLLYSSRSYALATLNAQTRFKWLMVFVCRVGELVSSPIIWLAMTSKLHELLSKHNKQKQLGLHLRAQAALAFIYFVLARSLAFLIHSINVSFHLHSENVDWFIMGFYKPLSANNNKTSGSHEANQNQPDSPLFSPLPGERQTYLHASRLFLRYNCLLCLILALTLGTSLAYVHYQIWREKSYLQKRSLAESQQYKKSKSPARGDGSQVGLSSIDERLSLDLMRIHSTSQGGGGNTRNIYPKATQFKKEDHSTEKESPKAKILFHYNLDRDEELSSNSSSVSTSVKDETTPETEQFRQPSTKSHLRSSLQATKKPELIIPIEVERGEAPSEDKAMGPKQNELRPTYSERLVSHRHRRVRIFEDNEQWPPSHRVAEGAGNRERGRVKGSRTITFAPTATLIGSDAGSYLSSERQSPSAEAMQPRPESEQEPEQERFSSEAPEVVGTPTFRTSSGSSSTATRASPEPSIDGSTTTNSSADDTAGSYVLHDGY